MSERNAIIVRDLGWRRIHRELKLLHRSFTDVGFQANVKHAEVARKRARVARKARGLKSEGALPDVAMIAFWLIYGTKHIPRRDFMGTALLVFADDLTRFRKHLLEQLYDGKITAKDALSMLGQRHEDQIKRTITTGNWIPNAKSTIRAKGSSKPLIDKGQMRNSVSHKETLRK